MELLLRRSKTDQEGAGRTVFIPYAKGSRCPVKALKNWLDLAEIAEGPLFRSVSRHDKVAGSKALTPQSVALIVKSSVRRMGAMMRQRLLRATVCAQAIVLRPPPLDYSLIKSGSKLAINRTLPLLATFGQLQRGKFRVCCDLRASSHAPRKSINERLISAHSVENS